MRRLAIFTVLMILSTRLWSQFANKSEFGLFGGGANYIGDLNGQSMLGKMNFSYGFLYRYTFNSRWVFRLNVMRGSLEGGNPDYYAWRNLSFRSSVTEVSMQIEFNFVSFFTGSPANFVSPYLFAGVGLFAFNPKGRYYNPETEADGWVELAPLNTEGQGSEEYADRKPYSLLQVSMPFGLGVKFSIGKNIGLGLEYGFRKTNTDYIDDVSLTYVEDYILEESGGQMAISMADKSPLIDGGKRNAVGTHRGDPSKKDWYSFVGVTCTFSIRSFTKQRSACDAFGKDIKPFWNRNNIYK